MRNSLVDEESVARCGAGFAGAGRGGIAAGLASFENTLMRDGAFAKFR